MYFEGAFEEREPYVGLGFLIIALESLEPSKSRPAEL